MLSFFKYENILTIVLNLTKYSKTFSIHINKNMVFILIKRSPTEGRWHLHVHGELYRDFNSTETVYLCHSANAEDTILAGVNPTEGITCSEARSLMAAECIVRGIRCGNRN